MSVALKCSNTDVNAKRLVTGVFTQHLRTALLNLSKDLTHDNVSSVFAGLTRACSLPLPSTLLDSQPLEKGGLDIEGNHLPSAVSFSLAVTCSFQAVCNASTFEPKSS